MNPTSQKHPIEILYETRLKQPAPEWVFQLTARIAKGLLPALSKRELLSIIEQFRGLLRGSLSLDDISLPKSIKARILGHFAAHLVILRQQAKVNAHAAQALAVLETKSDRLRLEIAEAVEGFLQSPYGEAKSLLAEFQQAFENSFSETGQIMGQNPYWRADFNILIAWPYVERLGSVANLHRFLVAQFGEITAGNLKRVEALCRSIGLKYRKRGKPAIIPKAPAPHD